MPWLLRERPVLPRAWLLYPRMRQGSQKVLDLLPNGQEAQHTETRGNLEESSPLCPCSGLLCGQRSGMVERVARWGHRRD